MTSQKNQSNIEELRDLVSQRDNHIYRNSAMTQTEKALKLMDIAEAMEKCLGRMGLLPDDRELRHDELMQLALATAVSRKLPDEWNFLTEQ